MKLFRKYNHYYKRLKVKHYRVRVYRHGERLGPRQYTTMLFAWIIACSMLASIGYVGTTLVRQDNRPDGPPVILPVFNGHVSPLTTKRKGITDILKRLNKNGTEITTAPGVITAEMITPSLTYRKTTATVFWAGEPAGPENDFIPNDTSAWDDLWQTHYGGFDDPINRNGYLPVGFTPKENPFYFALPYNDLDDNGSRKPTASLCPGSESKTNLNYSWCKNAWIAIKLGGKIVYAQWEDVGPNHEDDPEYVFGGAKPKNTFGERAGLDISPAVRDYLGVGDSSTLEWTFVNASDVPAGPWKQIVTVSLGYAVN